MPSWFALIPFHALHVINILNFDILSLPISLMLIARWSAGEMESRHIKVINRFDVQNVFFRQCYYFAA